MEAARFSHRCGSFGVGAPISSAIGFRQQLRMKHTSAPIVAVSNTISSVIPVGGRKARFSPVLVHEDLAFFIKIPLGSDQDRGILQRTSWMAPGFQRAAV